MSRSKRAKLNVLACFLTHFLLFLIFLSEVSAHANMTALSVMLGYDACVLQNDTSIRNSFILMLRLIHLLGQARPPTEQMTIKSV